MSKVKTFFSPKRLAIMAMFIALQIILARFVGLQLSEGLRISFEAIPVLLSSLWLGPVAGAIVGPAPCPLIPSGMDDAYGIDFTFIIAWRHDGVNRQNT